MRVDAAYARQSVEKKNSLSISGQLDLCRRAAGEQELRVYQDAGYSGKNTRRPAFQKLLKDIQADKIGTLYVYRLDRFSRSVADFGRLWEILQTHQVEFVSVSENFDTASPMGRAMLHIIMVFAQLERETTAQRVRDNYYRRVALGAWPGGPAPYGFRRGRAPNGAGRNIPTLLPDEHSETVRRIYREYGEEHGLSLRLLARRLIEEGIPSPAGKHWDSCAVSRVLHNPTYVMADEQVRLYYLGLGAQIVSPPEAFDGRHGLLLVGNGKYTRAEGATVSVLNSAGVVPAELWLTCQEKLNRNRQIGNSGRGTHSWLSGLMKCAGCGYSVTVAGQGDRLLCSGRYNRHCCDASIRISLPQLEERVEREILWRLSHRPQEKDAVAETYEKKSQEIDQKADRLVDAFARNRNMSERYLQRALARLDQERQMLENARKREEAVEEKKTDGKRFSRMGLEEKKKLAAEMIARIKLDKDLAEIQWKQQTSYNSINKNKYLKFEAVEQNKKAKKKEREDSEQNRFPRKDEKN